MTPARSDLVRRTLVEEGTPRPEAAVRTPATIERRVGLILRAGAALAVVLLSIGLVGMIATGSWGTRGAKSPGSVGRVLTDLGQGRPESVAALGIIVIVATPVAQLLTSALLFWRRRDRPYAAVTMLVLAIVGFGVLWTRGGG